MPTLPPLPTTSVPPVDETLTVAQATAQCVASGILAIDVEAMNTCVANLMNP